MNEILSHPTETQNVYSLPLNVYT